uniref:C2H2-type domain-containing protein n=1 Tax=Acrobeloides nanus TaxID=290746 RepID=A0A914CDS8_9BILA
MFFYDYCANNHLVKSTNSMLAFLYKVPFLTPQKEAYLLETPYYKVYSYLHKFGGLELKRAVFLDKMSESSSTDSTESDSPSSVKKFRVWNPALDNESSSREHISPKSDDHTVPEPSKSSPVLEIIHPQNQFLQQAAALNTYLQQMAMAAPILAKLQQQNRNPGGKMRQNGHNLLQMPIPQMRMQGSPMCFPGCFPPGLPIMPFQIPPNTMAPFPLPRIPMQMPMPMPNTAPLISFLGFPGCFPPGLPIMPFQIPPNTMAPFPLPRIPMQMPMPMPNTATSMSTPQVPTSSAPGMSLNPLTQAVLTGKSLAEANPNVCGFCNAEFKLISDLTQHLRDNHRKRKHGDQRSKNMPGSSNMAKNLSMRS